MHMRAPNPADLNRTVDPNFCGKDLHKYLYLVMIASVAVLGVIYWFNDDYREGESLSNRYQARNQQGGAQMGQPGMVDPATGQPVPAPLPMPQQQMQPMAQQAAVAIPAAVPEKLSFSDIVQAMMFSVVNVSASAARDPAAAGPTPQKQRMPGLRFANPFSGIATESVGSGVVVTAEGHILTNFHVVDKARHVHVTTFNALGTKRYFAEVMRRDPMRDLALLVIQPEQPLKPAPLGDSDPLRIGDPVIAIGSPFGLDQTVSKGIISGRRKAVNIGGVIHKGLLQTDAAINRGNSGGPLISLDGEVIGVNTAIFSSTDAFAGVGFAVPVNSAKNFLEEMIQLPEIARPQQVLRERLPETNTMSGRITTVAAVQGGGGAPPIAADAPLPHDDRGPCQNCHEILGPAAGGAVPVAAQKTAPPIAADAPMPHGDRGPCVNCHQLLPPMGGTAGQPVNFMQGGAGQGRGQGGQGQGMGPGQGAGPGVHRHMPAYQNRYMFSNGGAIGFPVAWTGNPSSIGLKLGPLDAKAAQAQQSPYTRGVVVQNVVAGSQAEKAGFKQGDVVFKMNGRWLESVDQYAGRLAKANPGEEIRLSVVRLGERMDLFLDLEETPKQGAANNAVATAPGGGQQPAGGAMTTVAAVQPQGQFAPQVQFNRPNGGEGQFTPQVQMRRQQGFNGGQGGQPNRAMRGQANGRQQRQAPVPTEFEWMGMELMPINAAMISRKPAMKNTRGAVVSDIDPRTAADKAGIQRGDIVTSINGNHVFDARALDAAIKKVPKGSGVLLEVQRKNQMMFAVMQ
ncbi:MAG: trypsin-like peptidase domain-containing protein [Magnetococcales bacterium]|nr:trypsin-like peptidase domain-containing protein [Magnetococcales bacterium]